MRIDEDFSKPADQELDSQEFAAGKRKLKNVQDCIENNALFLPEDKENNLHAQWIFFAFDQNDLRNLKRVLQKNLDLIYKEERGLKDVGLFLCPVFDVKITYNEKTKKEIYYYVVRETDQNGRALGPLKMDSEQIMAAYRLHKNRLQSATRLSFYNRYISKLEETSEPKINFSSYEKTRSIENPSLAQFKKSAITAVLSLLENAKLSCHKNPDNFSDDKAEKLTKQVLTGLRSLQGSDNGNSEASQEMAVADEDSLTSSAQAMEVDGGEASLKLYSYHTDFPDDGLADDGLPRVKQTKSNKRKSNYGDSEEDNSIPEEFLRRSKRTKKELVKLTADELKEDDNFIPEEFLRRSERIKTKLEDTTEDEPKQTDKLFDYAPGSDTHFPRLDSPTPMEAQPTTPDNSQRLQSPLAFRGISPITLELPAIGLKQPVLQQQSQVSLSGLVNLCAIRMQTRVSNSNAGINGLSGTRANATIPQLSPLQHSKLSSPINASGMFSSKSPRVLAVGRMSQSLAPSNSSNSSSGSLSDRNASTSFSLPPGNFPPLRLPNMPASTFPNAAMNDAPKEHHRPQENSTLVSQQQPRPELNLFSVYAKLFIACGDSINHFLDADALSKVTEEDRRLALSFFTEAHKSAMQGVAALFGKPSSSNASNSSVLAESQAPEIPKRN